MVALRCCLRLLFFIVWMLVLFSLSVGFGYLRETVSIQERPVVTIFLYIFWFP
jgi:hypothetical protein